MPDMISSDLMELRMITKHKIDELNYEETVRVLKTYNSSNIENNVHMNAKMKYYIINLVHKIR